MMYFIRRAGIDIKGDSHFCQALLNDSMIFIHDLLWRYAFFHGPDSNWDTMFIASTYKFYIPFLCPEIAYIDIGRDVTTCQVADMQRPVGIGKSSSNQVSFKISHVISL